MSFSQAVSGLNAASAGLDSIGNNIANSATNGFKGATTSFADMFAGSGVGLGVNVAAVTQNFKDGPITRTDRATDVAISGNGFSVFKIRMVMFITAVMVNFCAIKAVT